MTQAMLRPLPERASLPVLDGRAPTIGGEFFFVGDHKLYLRGVSYGPFAAASHGLPFPGDHILERDPALLAGVRAECPPTVSPRAVRASRRFLPRLQNLSEDKPLVLTEFGVDSIREGAQGQGDMLAWMIRAAFESGVAGTFVFSWTDEWFTGGSEISDWAFG